MNNTKNNQNQNNNKLQDILKREEELTKKNVLL